MAIWSETQRSGGMAYLLSHPLDPFIGLAMAYPLEDGTWVWQRRGERNPNGPFESLEAAQADAEAKLSRVFDPSLPLTDDELVDLRQTFEKWRARPTPNVPPAVINLLPGLITKHEKTARERDEARSERDALVVERDDLKRQIDERAGALEAGRR